MNLILLGCPGAGKGTQAEVLAAKRGLKHLSTGAIFREEMQGKTELGRRVDKYVSSGKLVPDELVVEVVASRVTGEGAGVILDGVPRTIKQAEELDKILAKNGQKIDAVLYFKLTQDEAVRRLLGRGRSDDTEATVKTRFMVYADQTEPLIAYYRAQKVLVEIDADAPIESVTTAVESKLQEKVQP